MNRDRLYPLLITVAVALVIVAVLCLCYLSYNGSRTEPPSITAAIDDEDYAELFNPEAVTPIASEASEAFNDIPEANASLPAPPSGTDLDTQGASEATAASAPKTSTRPSPVKSAEQDALAAAAEKKQKEEEEVRRRATSDLKSAFGNTSGSNNTSNPGSQPGDSGSPTGSTSTAQSGHGTGRVNGGWKMPAYEKVPSTLTGSIELKAIVNRHGVVTSVENIGGQAPAATNAALIEACKAEIRRRTFTRSDNNAPETATAYITYRFN